MGQKSVWSALLTLSVLANTSAVNKTSFGFYPDRDRIELFSVRVPISAVSHSEPDSINVKIENDEGYICAEETPIRDLEISGLPCNRCMKGKLLVTVETKKENEILPPTHTILSDESRRTEICGLQQESQKQGEDLVVTIPKEQLEDGCRWVFRDAGGSVGCCYSNRDYYTQTGGCDPRMQSSACRKGSESPILEEKENSCTFIIENLTPADSGNYLSKFMYETPGFKKVLTVEGDGRIPNSGILIICLAYISLIGALIVLYFTVNWTSLFKQIKEIPVKNCSFDKAKKAELQDEVKKLSPPDHVA